MHLSAASFVMRPSRYRRMSRRIWPARSSATGRRTGTPRGTRSSSRAPTRRSNTRHTLGSRARPPGPEAQRGATATGGGAGNNVPQRTWRDLLRSPIFWIAVLALLLLNRLLVPLLWPESNDRVTVSYSAFKDQVTARNVAEITVQGEAIQGVFKQPVADAVPPAGQAPQTYSTFATRIPPFAANENLAALLEQQGVQISATAFEAGRSTLLTFLLSFGPALLLLGGVFWLSTRGSG